VRLLKSFHATNYLAICKITKKHDKYAPDWKASSDVILPLLETFDIYPDTDDLQDLTRALEKLYLDDVAAPRKLDPEEALVKLRSHSAPQESAMVTFLGGFSVGGVLGISVTSFVSFAFSVASFSSLFLESDANQTQLKTDLAAGIPIFRLLFLPALAYLFWGVNLMVFEKKRINVRYIMSADPRSFLQGSTVILISVIILIIVLVAALLLIIMVNTHNALGRSLIPLSILLTFGVCLMLPVKGFLYHNTRIYFWKTMQNIVVTPLWEYETKHVFFADHWTSMGVVLLDLQYALYFYFTGSFLSSGNYWYIVLFVDLTSNRTSHFY
jgi:hypothetical protein